MSSYGFFRRILFQKRVGREYKTAHVNKDSVYSLTRYDCKSKSFSGLRKLIICFTVVQKKSRIEHCCVIYYLGFELKDE